MVKYTPLHYPALEYDADFGGMLYSESGKFLGSFEGFITPETNTLKVRYFNSNTIAPMAQETWGVPHPKRVKSYVKDIERQVRTHEMSPQKALLFLCGFLEVYGTQNSVQFFRKSSHDRRYKNRKIPQAEQNPDDYNEYSLDFHKFKPIASAIEILSQAAEKMAKEVEQDERMIHAEFKKSLKPHKEKDAPLPQKGSHTENIRRQRDKPNSRDL
jgi:hypothetical protein